MASPSSPLKFALTCVSAARYPSYGMANAMFACGLVMLRYFGNRPCLVFRGHEAAFTSKRAAAVTNAVSNSGPIGTFAVRGSFPRNWRPWVFRSGWCLLRSVIYWYTVCTAVGARLLCFPGSGGRSIMCATRCISVATNSYLLLSGGGLVLSALVDCFAHPV